MSDNVVDTIRQRVDIVDLVSESAPLRKQGRTFKANCPFHVEKTPSFNVDPERQTWRCFGACATGGDVFSFVMKRDGVEFPEALRTLAERAGVELNQNGGRESREVYDRLIAANEAAIAYFRQAFAGSAAGAEARAYAERRGLDAKTLEAFEIGFAPEGWDNLKGYLTGKGFAEQDMVDGGLLSTGDSGSTYDRFRRRLIFPIRDDRGRAVGFGGRALDDAKPKYLNTPQTPLFDKGHLLYALDKAKEAVRKSDEVVVVEGYLDAIAAHQFGYPNVVASLGTALTDEHVRLLRRLTKRVTLCMDADAAGLDAAIRGEEVARAAVDGAGPVEAVVAWDGLVRLQARAAVQVRVFTVPSGKDPDEAIREDTAGWPAWVASALAPFEFRLRLEQSRTQMSDPRARVEMADRMLPLLLQIGDPALMSSYIQHLARLVMVPESDLMARLQQLAPPKQLGTPINRQAPNTNKLKQWQNLPVRGDNLEQREPAAPAPRPVTRDRIETYVLALVLRHPSLVEAGEALDPALFQQSDLRQVFECWRLDHDLGADGVPEELQPALAALHGVFLPPMDGPSAERALVDAVQKLRQRLIAEQKRLNTAEILEAQEGVQHLQRPGEDVDDPKVMTIVSRLEDDGYLAKELHALEAELRLHRSERIDLHDERESA